VSKSVVAGEGENAKVVEATIEFPGQAAKRVKCFASLTKSVDVILGRSFFKDQALTWDIEGSTLAVGHQTENGKSGEAIDFEKGTFSSPEGTVRLPVISPLSYLPKGTPLPSAFDFVTGAKTFDSVPEDEYVLTKYGGRCQLVVNIGIAAKELDERQAALSLVPGGTYFGNQKVIIDFQKNQIIKVDNLALSALSILQRRSMIRFGLVDGRGVITGSDKDSVDEILRAKQLIGWEVARIGSIPLDATKLKNFDYLVEVYRELSKSKSVRIENATTFFTINFTD
jgi:hypothetical protein